jgi:hypothetical protein
MEFVSCQDKIDVLMLAQLGNRQSCDLRRIKLKSLPKSSSNFLFQYH